MGAFFAACLLALLVSSGAGAYVATQKRRPAAEGFLFGLILGPVGVLVVACLPQGDRVPPRPGPTPAAARGAARASTSPRVGLDPSDLDRPGLAIFVVFVMLAVFLLARVFRSGGDSDNLGPRPETPAEVTP
jgi:hypothetical protein